jgi:hypothetical protein
LMIENRVIMQLTSSQYHDQQISCMIAQQMSHTCWGCKANCPATQ